MLSRGNECGHIPTELFAKAVEIKTGRLLWRLRHPSSAWDGTMWDHHPIPKKNMVQYGPNLGGWKTCFIHYLRDGFCVEYLAMTMIYIDLENYTFSNGWWDWMFKNFWHLIACFCLALSTFLKQQWRLNQLSNLDMTSMFGWWFQCMYCSSISEKSDQHWVIFVRWVCHHMPPTSHDQRLICVRWYMLFI